MHTVGLGKLTTFVSHINGFCFLCILTVAISKTEQLSKCTNLHTVLTENLTYVCLSTTLCFVIQIQTPEHD